MMFHHKLFVVCAVATTGAVRIQQADESSVESMLDFANRYATDPEVLLEMVNSGSVETNQSNSENWFWSRNSAQAQNVDLPIGGTNPTWARWRPTIEAVDANSQPGKVISVHTFGAPSNAKVPLTDDNTHDGCFPGYRTFHGDEGTTDPVAWLASAGGFVHPMTSAMTLYSGQPPSILPCNNKTAELPAADSALDLALHFTTGYLQDVQQEREALPPNLELVATLMRAVYVPPAEAAELAGAVGYKLVGESDNENDLTRLFQDPQSLDCIISFRGSDNAQDWINNIGIGSRDFCNFEEVHSGFVQKFTDTVSAPQFQRNIRANFPKCTSLRATGHSLGGAVAEMFAACANRGPKDLTPLADLPRRNSLTVAHSAWMTYIAYLGQITWTRSTPERMAAIA